MKIRRLSLIGTALIMSVPAFANTYYAGFEDLKYGDYDYNDMVFTLNGNGLTLNTSHGQWYDKPTLGSSGVPFWNNASWDLGKKNIGFCIYGGGDCGTGLDPIAKYLASSTTSKTDSANDVTFTVDPSQNVTASISLEITAGSNVLGYYDISHPNTIYWLNTHGQTGMFQFTPTGTFGIAAETALDQTFYSQTNYDRVNDSVSHFAFFGDAAAAPEPGAMGLMAGVLILVGSLFRRRKVKA
jgi:hypothetical protein